MGFGCQIIFMNFVPYNIYLMLNQTNLQFHKFRRLETHSKTTTPTYHPHPKNFHESETLFLQNPRLNSKKTQRLDAKEVQSVEGFNHQLKNLSSKIEGISALLTQDSDETFNSSELELKKIIPNQNKNASNVKSFDYQLFYGRTTCPNKLKKNSTKEQFLRKTTNKDSFLSNAFPPSVNKPKSNASKKPQFLNGMKGIKNTFNDQKSSNFEPSSEYSCFTPTMSEKDFFSSKTMNKFSRYNLHENQLKSKKTVESQPQKWHQSVENSFSQQRSGAKIKQFRIIKKLGKGKFGQVLLGYHLPTKSIYALKKITKAMVKEQKMIHQFLDEIKLHTSLQHPNIIKLFGFFEEDDAIYLVLQYVHGQTLFDYLNQKEKLSLKETIPYLRDIIGAITYLHDKSIAHRDIKPQNILLSSEGVIKICDFGWSALIQTSRKTYCGTLDYVSPEILQRKDYDLSVDIWCLGILTYQLLTGDVPFNGEQRKSKINKILSVDKNKIDFPVYLSPYARDFIEALIQKDPKKRLKIGELLKHELFVKSITK